jgi:Carboxypeptidase regulatory-like domain
MSFFSRRRVCPYSLCGVLAFAAFSGVCARAQSGTSAIRGQVLDAQSRGIPGARVAILDGSHKLNRSQVTDGSGQFFFAGLLPGTYELDAEAPGFKKLAIEHVASPVNVITEAPVHLELGEVTQSVTVASSQEALQTADATLGNPFEGQRIEELPLNACVFVYQPEHILNSTS